MSDSVNFITRASITQAAPLETERLLALAKDRAPDPTAFEGRIPFFMRAQISSNELDFYYSIMMPPTLERFRDRLSEGISLLENHNTYSNANAQSLEGVLDTSDDTVELTGDKRMTVSGTFWSVRDLEVNGKSTNGWIDAVRLGIWKDVSVGFHATDIRCSICGEQVYSGFMSFDGEGCTHLPGLTYKQERGTKEVLCWSAIMDGDLHETSNVYDGATPNAVVSKAEQLATEGAIGEGERMVLAHHYGERAVDRIKLRAKRHTTGTPVRQKGSKMTRIAKFETLDQVRALRAVAALESVDTDQVVATTDDGTELTLGAVIGLVSDVDTLVDDTSADDAVAEVSAELETIDDVEIETAADDTERSKTVKRARAVVTALRSARTNATELERDAKFGRDMRTKMLDEVCTEGKRARGESFNEAHVRSFLAGADLDQLTYMRDDYRAIGDKLFGIGGRRTNATEQEGENPPTEDVVVLDTSHSRMRGRR